MKHTAGDVSGSDSDSSQASSGSPQPKKACTGEFDTSARSAARSSLSSAGDADGENNVYLYSDDQLCWDEEADLLRKRA